MNALPPVIENSHAAGLIAIDGRMYPLKEVRLASSGNAGIARSTLIQRFANPYEETLEVCYSLALPADGAVIGYRITLGETSITSRIETRGQARSEYQKAMAEGRLGGLMEQERPDTFTQWLGNLPGKTEVEVEIDVLHPLLFHATTAITPARNAAAMIKPVGAAAEMTEPVSAGQGLWEYRFPTVPGVRYLGQAGRIPDADRISVDRGDSSIPVRLDLDLRVADGPPSLILPGSSSHKISVERDGHSESVVRLIDSARLDRDIVVTWRATRDEVGAIMAVGRGLPGDDGYYGLLSLTPPEIPVETLPRDLILLMDCSGSMHGAPLDAVRLIAREVIQSLGPHDTFELIAFADRPCRFASHPASGTSDEVAQALRWLDRLEAGGCTEMADAVAEALRPLRLKAQRQVILMTDGFIGFESEVAQCVARTLPESCRVHTVGIGSAPNRSLTKTVARCGRGVEVFASGPEAAGDAAARLLASTAAPILTDVTVTGSAIVRTAQRRAPDMYMGRPGCVVLELDPEGGSIHVRGRLGSEGEWSRTVMVPSSVASAAAEGGALGAGGDAEADTRKAVRSGAHSAVLPIGALFGREVIADLECDLFAGLLNSATAEQQIEACGLRHHIPSRMTSLVAISMNRITDPGKPRRLIRPAQELPYGVSAEGVGLAGPMAPEGPAGEQVSASMLEDLAETCEDRTSMPSRARSRYTRSLSHDDHDGPSQSSSISGEMNSPFAPARSHLAGELLVLEFEVIRGSHIMPKSGDVILVIIGDVIRSASVHTSSSAGGAILEAGEVVRLVLKTADGALWPTGAGLVIWSDREAWIEFGPSEDA